GHLMSNSARNSKRSSIWISTLFLLLITLTVRARVFAASPAQTSAPVQIQNQAPVQRHEFRFDARKIDPKPRAVHLTGSFNNFSHSAAAMIDDGSGNFSITLDLPPGLHHYKFLADEDRWFTDPAADL